MYFCHLVILRVCSLLRPFVSDACHAVIHACIKFNPLSEGQET